MSMTFSFRFHSNFRLLVTNLLIISLILDKKICQIIHNNIKLFISKIKNIRVLHEIVHLIILFFNLI